MNMEQNAGGACRTPQPTGAPNFPQACVYQDPAKKDTHKQRRGEALIPITGVDALFAVLAFVCGYLFIWLASPLYVFSPDRFGVGVTFFAACFYLMFFLYMHKMGVRPSKGSYGWLALSVVSALYFALFSNGVLKFFNLFFFIASAAYWVGAAGGNRLEPSLGRVAAPDLLDQLFWVPLFNFSCGPKILRGAAGRNRKSKNLLAAALGALAAVPLLIVVVLLLTQADDTFARMVREMQDGFGVHLVNFLLRVIPAALMGCYFFGMWYGNVQKRCVALYGKEQVEQKREKRRKLPNAMTVTVLALLCGVYLVFFGAQAATLFSAFAGVRPEGFTYAGYARRGFFELCGVASINLAVLGGARLFTARHGEKPVRSLPAFSVALSAETLLLIATALSKMVLYIRQYGLTLLRVYTSWFMILLFVVFGIAIVAQFRKINLAKTLVAAFFICFLLLCYSNVDGLVAQYNIGRYMDGSLDSLDISALYTTPEAARPYIKTLYENTDDKELRRELKERWERNDEWRKDTLFYEQNLELYLAQKDPI